MPGHAREIDERMLSAAAAALLIIAALVAWLAGAPTWLLVAIVIAAAIALLALGIRGEAARRRLSHELAAHRDGAARAAASLAEREEAGSALVSLIQAAPEPILATDEQGRIEMCNAAAAALLGLDPQRILGRPIGEVFTQEEVLRLHAEGSRGSTLRKEVRISRAGGARVWEVAAAPVTRQEQGPSPVVMTIRDITDQARAMQVKSDFAANASHELRTPIAAMRVAMDTLQSLDEGEDPNVRARFTAMLARNLERVEAMVRDLLDLAKLESPNAQVRSERFVAASLETDLQPVFEKVLTERRLTLRFDFAPEVSELTTDRNLLLLILSNLVDNATKYAFEGTEVRVLARAAGRGDLRLEVIDQGIGIPLDQQQRIFERYYQVDAARSVGAARRGTGLGLSIVKHAIRRLGGTIRVESVWQQGTRMIVEIPGAISGPGSPGTPNRALV